MGGRRGAPFEGLRQAWLPFLIFLLAAAIGCGAGPSGVPDERDDPNVAPLGGPYVPAGFGEGPVWATDIFVCDGTGVFSSSASCGSSADASMKRLDPRTGEEEAKIPLEGFFANTTEAAFGAGSVWVSSADYGPGTVEGR